MVTLVGSLAPLAILNAANTTQLSLLLTKAVPASHLAISIPGPELEAIPDTLHANRRQAGGVGMELGWLAVEFGSVGFGRVRMGWEYLSAWLAGVQVVLPLHCSRFERLCECPCAC